MKLASCRLKCKMRDDRAERPIDILVHIAYGGQRTRRQGSQAAKNNAPNTTQSIDIVHRTVRNWRTTKCFGEIDQAMGRQARQGNTRERQCIYPGITHLMATRSLLYKCTIKGRVVSKYWHPTHELGKLGDSLLARWRIGNVDLLDAC